MWEWNTFLSKLNSRKEIMANVAQPTYDQVFIETESTTIISATSTHYSAPFQGSAAVNNTPCGCNTFQGPAMVIVRQFSFANSNHRQPAASKRNPTACIINQFIFDPLTGQWSVFFVHWCHFHL